MSTVQATNLKNASSTTNNAVMTAGGDFTNAAGISYMGGSKNLLINSAMQISQRGTSVASITGGGYYTADRWFANIATLGTWTQSVEEDAPAGSGFRKSLKMLCTTASASPAAGGLVRIDQYLEGQDLQRIAKGTASAQQLTLSFWVKSNVTGTYVVALQDNDNNRTVSATYIINAANTWEKKTTIFPADAVGVFDNDNALSLGLRFWLAAGSDRTSGTLNTAWASVVAANLAVGQTNLASSTNNFWQITGTQLEIGPAATSFEFEPYETTLRKCQRYYERGFFWYEGPANGGSQNVRNIQYSVQKRTGVYPTAGNYGNVSGSNSNITSHAPEDGYDVYNPSYPQSNSNTGFNWRFVATSTGNCTIRQWWAANAEL